MKRTITLQATRRSRLKLKHAFTTVSVEMESIAGTIILFPRMSFTVVDIYAALPYQMACFMNI